jgi:serine/threonine protein kinase
MVGDYRLLTKIGEGGMGVVHLAQAPDGDRVALKVLRPHIVGDDEARERLAREVASLRRVRSPRVAEIVDADPWGETPFVATRYVPGLSLHEHIRQEGPVEGGDLRWFAAGLAEAVIAVHSVGVLHRDIKPSNILLEGRSPVLIDFGLARLAEDPRLTATGWLLGTPGYLAPEILYGDDATAAADAHSWAAPGVFAATGRPPFGRGPAMAIMDRVRRGEHDLTGVPADLLPHVERCLAPEAADRPELAAVLSSLRGGLRPRRRDPSTGRSTSRPCRSPSPRPRTRTAPRCSATTPRPWACPRRRASTPRRRSPRPRAPTPRRRSPRPRERTRPPRTPRPPAGHRHRAVSAPAGAGAVHDPGPAADGSSPAADAAPGPAGPGEGRRAVAPPPGGWLVPAGHPLLGLFALVAVLFTAAPCVSVVLLGVGRWR